MQEFDLLIDPADGCLDACVSRPYLVAIYAELSHGLSLRSLLRQPGAARKKCGKLGYREFYSECSAAANGLVGNYFTLVALNNRVHD